MDIKKIRDSTVSFLHKYRYAALVLLIGIVLMMLPSFGGEEVEEESPVQQSSGAEISIDAQLEELLSNVSGVGQVQVMLTFAKGEETVYQTDQEISTSDNSTSTRIETVVITDAQRAQSGLICQTNPPVYLGAIVLCQGADSPSVRLAVVEAVSKITGLGADQIAVLKMN